jgi:EgtB-related family protein
VGALPGGESAFGCRQLIGNVWEWTGSPFRPYPGFRADEAYPEYSAPWFETAAAPSKVLRGGCWATTARLIRSTWRNFYPADRRNVWAGFRTCALEGWTSRWTSRTEGGERWTSAWSPLPRRGRATATG